jgi:hypothetical protein
MGFIGSEDYIRLQFEEYILSMVSAVKYHIFLGKHAGSDLNVFLPDVGERRPVTSDEACFDTSRWRSFYGFQSRFRRVLAEN